MPAEEPYKLLFGVVGLLKLWGPCSYKVIFTVWQS